MKKVNWIQKERKEKTSAMVPLILGHCFSVTLQPANLKKFFLDGQLLATLTNRSVEMVVAVVVTVNLIQIALMSTECE